MIDPAILGDRATPGRVRDRVGEWVLRAADGVTGRANSCCAVGDPGCSTAAAIDRVEAWYGRHGRPAIVQLFDHADPDVCVELDRRGYVTGAVTDVLAVALDAVRSTGGGRFSAEVVTSMPGMLRAELGARRAREMTDTVLPRRFAVASCDGQDLGAGLAVIDGPTVGVFAMRTRSDAQGRGIGGSVLSALLNEGREHGCTTAWLQVEVGNERARTWYERLGFVRVGGYRYRQSA